MDDLTRRLATLSPEERALLEQWLVQQAPAPKTNAVTPRRTDGPIPLTYAQRRLWLIDQLEPGSALYNINRTLQIRGPLEVGALQQALDALVARHEVLRTAILQQDGIPVQVVHPPLDVPMEVRDLRMLSDAEREDEAHRLLHAEVHTGFDLKRAPLLRTLVLRVDDETHLISQTVHHIVSDGWSLGMHLRELSVLYSAIVQGETPDLSPVALHYADYAVWEQSAVQEERLQDQLRYWQQRLTELPMQDLPTDYPRPARRSTNGDFLSFTLPESLVQRLRELGHQERATLYMVLLAAFSVLLHRYTHQRHVAVGSPIAHRNQREMEHIMGLFVNTLVHDVVIDRGQSFRSLVGIVRDRVVEALANQDVPFEALVEAVQPTRDLSRTPLFQVMFSLQNQPRSELKLHGLEVETLPIYLTPAKFDLTILMTEQPGEFVGRVRFATDLFRRETVERLIEHYRVLLQRLVENPDDPLAMVPLLTETERQQLARWNDTAKPFPKGTILDVFAEQVVRTPNAPAVSDEMQVLTYAALDEQADAVAHALHVQGVQAGDTVGLLADRSVALVVGMVGILKAGGVYVPLDPTYPPDRLAWMVEDAGVVAIVGAAEEARARFPKLPAIDPEQVTLPTEVLPPVTRAASDPSYVIYTSGSTGTPKGVVVPHQAIIALVRETDYVQLGPNDRLAQVSNASFDAITFEVWGALLNGAQVVVFPRETVLAPRRLAAALRENGITTLFLTTSLFNLVAQEMPEAFRTLTQVLLGGERADPRWVRAVLEAAPPQRLLNVYGPTEATTFATWQELDILPEDAASVPIGRALANTTLHVLDPYQQPVPIGVDGELYIGGPGVSLGYWNRPALTASRFVSEAQGTAAERLYRTGDTVRWREDGTLDFIGRTDRQVKIRGFRIELGEVEAALLRHEQVRSAVVDVAASTDATQYLVAFVESAAGSALESELRAFLHKRLPEYMVPLSIIVAPSLPLTPNGKVDRERLPLLTALSETPVVLPRTPTEQYLHGVWKTLLQRDEISVQDRFFELGGHSLMAAQLFARIEDRFGCRLPLATLFEASTIAQLAVHLDAQIEEGPARKQAKGWDNLVQLESGPAPCFFWVHGSMGNVLSIQRLAAQLRDTVGSYGVQATGLDGRQRPLDDIPEMARRYLERIRQVQPEGPYRFGGYSFGGVVAVELAIQAQEQGLAVEQVVMLDAGAPASLHRAHESGRQFLERRSKKDRKKLFVRIRNGRFFKIKLGKVKQRMLLRMGTKESAEEKLHRIGKKISKYCRRSLKRYRPAVYEGPVLYVCALETKTKHNNALVESWQRVLPNMEVFEVEGAHHEVLVAATREEIKKRLTRSLPPEESA